MTTCIAVPTGIAPSTKKDLKASLLARPDQDFICVCYGNTHRRLRVANAIAAGVTIEVRYPVTSLLLGVIYPENKGQVS